MLSQTNPDSKAPRWSVPCRSPAHQTKEIASVFAPRLAVNGADGADERLALLRCQLQDLASFHPDGGHRIVLEWLVGAPPSETRRGIRATRWAFRGWSMTTSPWNGS